jgi:chemotaxis protein histidine kinase CheA
VLGWGGLRGRGTGKGVTYNVPGMQPIKKLDEALHHYLTGALMGEALPEREGETQHERVTRTLKARSAAQYLGRCKDVLELIWLKYLDTFEGEQVQYKIVNAARLWAGVEGKLVDVTVAAVQRAGAVAGLWPEPGPAAVVVQATPKRKRAAKKKKKRAAVLDESEPEAEAGPAPKACRLAADMQAEAATPATEELPIALSRGRRDLPSVQYNESEVRWPDQQQQQRKEAAQAATQEEAQEEAAPVAAQEEEEEAAAEEEAHGEESEGDCENSEDERFVEQNIPDRATRMAVRGHFDHCWKRHLKILADAKQFYEDKLNKHLEKERQQHGAELAAAKQQHGAELAAAKQQHGAELAAAKQQHGAELAAARQQHGAAVEAAQKQHQRLVERAAAAGQQQPAGAGAVRLTRERLAYIQAMSSIWFGARANRRYHEGIRAILQGVDVLNIDFQNIQTSILDAAGADHLFRETVKSEFEAAERYLSIKGKEL